MNTELLQTVRVGPEQADYCVIWMHGLGADGHDFEPIVPELNFAAKARTRFVFPHAPVRPITVNNGMAMRAWYDLPGIDATSPEDEEGIRASARLIEALIRDETSKGIAPANIILAGFSQGGAMALHVGLRQTRPLAGILALSAYLPLRSRFDTDVPSPPALPIFMAHGEADPVVPLSLAQASRALLEGHGVAIEWHTYPMDHAVIPAEIDAISAWFGRVLS